MKPRIGPHILCRHQPRVVAEGELAGEMMRSDAGLHAYQARCQVCQSRLDLTARPLLAQHNRTRLSWPTTWNEFLPMSMPITAIWALAVLGMGVLLVMQPLASVVRWRGRSTAGSSH
jgi:hypothetical protein